MRRFAFKTLSQSFSPGSYKSCESLGVATQEFQSLVPIAVCFCFFFILFSWYNDHMKLLVQKAKKIMLFLYNNSWQVQINL